MPEKRFKHGSLENNNQICRVSDNSYEWLEPLKLNIEVNLDLHGEESSFIRSVLLSWDFSAKLFGIAVIWRQLDSHDDKMALRKVFGVVITNLLFIQGFHSFILVTDNTNANGFILGTQYIYNYATKTEVNAKRIGPEAQCSVQDFQPIGRELSLGVQASVLVAPIWQDPANPQIQLLECQVLIRVTV